MVDPKPYNDELNCGNLDELIELFLESLLETNRTCEFFVDWQKVEDNVEQFSVQLNILNSLLRCSPADIESEFRELIHSYPLVIPVLPLLIAVRDREIKVAESLSDEEINIVCHSFKAGGLLSNDIDGLVRFCRDVGLFNLFTNTRVTNLVDYLYGVEVGMDTNARKNRGGSAFEMLLAPKLEKLRSSVPGAQLFKQMRFKDLPVELNPPEAISERKFDFVFAIPGSKAIMPTNIEVNFFGGTGSKLDILTSYIHRQSVLKEVGWRFVLITDGFGWKKTKNLLREAFSRLDYVMNADFVRRGLLSKILITP